MKQLHVPSSSRGSNSKPATGKAKLSILLCPVIVKATRKHAAHKGESLSAFVTRAVKNELIMTHAADRVPLMFTQKIVDRCKEASKTCGCGTNYAAEMLLDYALERHEAGIFTIKPNS